MTAAVHRVPPSAGYVVRGTSTGSAAQTAFVFGLASLATLFAAHASLWGPVLHVYVRRGRIVRVRLLP